MNVCEEICDKKHNRNWSSIALSPRQTIQGRVSTFAHHDASPWELRAGCEPHPLRSEAIEKVLDILTKQKSAKNNLALGSLGPAKQSKQEVSSGHNR